MLWRMRQRWLTWGPLGVALLPWMNNVAHPKALWWGRLPGPLAMRRWAFTHKPDTVCNYSWSHLPFLIPEFFFLFFFFLLLGPWYEQLWRFPQLWSPSGNQDLSLGTQALLSRAATDGPELNRTQSSPSSSPSWPGLTADPTSLQFWECHPSLSSYPGLPLQFHQSKSAFRYCNWLVSFVSALNNTVLRLKEKKNVPDVAVKSTVCTSLTF